MQSVLRFLLAPKAERGPSMAAITVRSLDDDVKHRLRVRAAKHGHSMEAEVRAILVDAVAEEEPSNWVEVPRAVRCARRRRAGYPAADRWPPRTGRVRLMIVLDTNVLSELMKESPNETVWRWLQGNPNEELYTTAITAAEILRHRADVGRSRAGRCGRLRTSPSPWSRMRPAVVHCGGRRWPIRWWSSGPAPGRSADRRPGCADRGDLSGGAGSARDQEYPGLRPDRRRAGQSVGVRPYRAVDAESRDRVAGH